MPRIVKVAAASAGTAIAVTAAFFLHPRSGAGRRAAVRRESASVAALVGSAIDAPRRRSGARLADSVAVEVRRALHAAFGDASEEIGVKVDRGVVTLRGEVDDLEDIGRYDAVARSAAGVTEVDNLLRLRLTGSAKPHVLTA